MYNPPHFDEPRTEVLHDLIRRHPLGALVTHGADGLDANHIPFELASEGELGTALGTALGTLRAHVARANPVWQELADGAEVLVIFRAGDAYISPNWYPSKHELHQQVPTWNYMVAHAHGRVTIRDDARYVRGVLARLTRTHEAAQAVPWKMGDSAPEFIDDLLDKIVGIEIAITRLAGKFKLSQNKELRDLHSAAEMVRGQGKEAIGAAMLACAAAASTARSEPDAVATASSLPRQ